MVIGNLRIALLAALVATLPALEIVGTPPTFLTTTLTPTWRLTPITTVLDELERSTKLTFKRSIGVIAVADHPLLLVSTQAMTCRAILAELERCADVRFTMSKDGLSVERSSEFDQRHREVRWYPLNEYGLVEPPRNAIAPMMGFAGHRIDGDTAVDLPSAGRKDALAYDPEQLVEFIRHHVSPSSWELEGVGIEQRGGVLVIYQTPENHVRIRDVLASLRERLGRTRRWQVTFGLLAKDDVIPTGIVATEVAQGVSTRLVSTTTLTLSGLPGQQVQAAKLDEQSAIVSVEVVNHQLDPRPIAIKKGRSATICALSAHQGTLLEVTLAWVEDAEKAVLSEVHSATRSLPVTAIARERVPLQLPVLWSWQPALELLLPSGHTLILSSEHPSGQAVMVLEERP
jgi:hypothetical protein